MITLLYILLVAYILAMVLWNLYREKDLGFEVTAVLVVIPLLLRLAGVK